MKSLKVEYSHEFISNKISDELILNNIWNYSDVEQKIIDDLQQIFQFNIEPNRNINTLSGGQRSIAYLITLSYILKQKQIDEIELTLINIVESLTQLTVDKIFKYLEERGIHVN